MVAVFLEMMSKSPSDRGRHRRRLQELSTFHGSARERHLGGHLGFLGVKHTNVSIYSTVQWTPLYTASRFYFTFTLVGPL